mmetsp:Transcript_20909/g.53935  ORF Transcript_20909/g.53935 Transcript_20909/m.53935 type:complete len:339 (+) Transcript_20909:352-1368(+)
MGLPPNGGRGEAFTPRHRPLARWRRGAGGGVRSERAVADRAARGEHTEADAEVFALPLHDARADGLHQPAFGERLAGAPPHAPQHLVSKIVLCELFASWGHKGALGGGGDRRGRGAATRRTTGRQTHELVRGKVTVQPARPLPQLFRLAELRRVHSTPTRSCWHATATAHGGRGGAHGQIARRVGEQAVLAQLVCVRGLRCALVRRVHCPAATCAVLRGARTARRRARRLAKAAARRGRSRGRPVGLLAETATPVTGARGGSFARAIILPLLAESAARSPFVWRPRPAAILLSPAGIGRLLTEAASGPRGGGLFGIVFAEAATRRSLLVVPLVSPPAA